MSEVCLIWVDRGAEATRARVPDLGAAAIHDREARRQNEADLETAMSTKTNVAREISTRSWWPLCPMISASESLKSSLKNLVKLAIVLCPDSGTLTVAEDLHLCDSARNVTETTALTILRGGQWKCAEKL